MRVIGDLSRANARRYPDKIALCHGEHVLTYRELDERSNRLANAVIAAGVEPGDRVALLAHNCLDFAVVTQGTAKAGAILVPMNFRLAAAEIAHILRDAEPKLILSEAAFAESLAAVFGELAAPPRAVMIDDAGGLEGALTLEALIAGQPATQPEVAVDPASPCVIMYTSGTTGFPKGVLVSHDAYFRLYFATAIDTHLRHDDVFLMAVPMFHMAGMNLMLHQALFLGATGVIHRGRFDPEAAFALIEHHRISVAILVPTIIGVMAEHPARTDYDLSSWRAAFYGSMPMPPPVLRAAMDAFPQLEFHQLYGSTETGMLSVLTWADHATHPHSSGRETLLSHVRIVDDAGRDVAVGEVGKVLGHQSTGMIGYWRNDKATAETVRDGWIDTGDLARREDRGFFSLVGRAKEVIISGGENIYPTEVERVLADHPAVAEVAVLGLPDPLYGESVCAALVLYDGMAASAAELDAACRAALAGFKCPRRYEFLDALPRNASDKVQKNVLRDRFADKAGEEGRHVG